MSKPKNNRVMCPDCGRAKMLFTSEKKASDFIKWNGDDIDTHGGELRSYYCPSCCGWHITSKPYSESYSHRTDNIIGAYHRQLKASANLKVAGVGMFGLIDRIWDSMPPEVKNSSSKSVVKNYVSVYYEENGVIESDSGATRRAIYEKWKRNRLGVIS